MRTPDRVSLAFELSDLESALRGGQQLVEQVAANVLDDAAEAQRVLVRAEAVIGFVAARLRLLRSAVRREIDPELVRTSGNAVHGRTAHDDPDIELAPWGPAEWAAHAAAVLRQIDAEHGRPRRR